MAQPQTTQAMMPPTFSFDVDEALHPWNMAPKQWLTKHNKDWDGLATGNVVFDPQGRVLVVQRAAHDSMQNKWEIPGGAADDEDPTLFHGAARELWEETGLIAKRFTHIVSEGPGTEPGQVFPNSTHTKTWCRFSFIVEAESCEDVKLNSNEHQDYTWATEDQIRTQKIGERELPITRVAMQSLILEAFRLRKENTKPASL